MPTRHRSGSFRLDASFVVFTAFMCIVWLAGGASHANVLGQAVVRSAAWTALIIILLTGELRAFRLARPVWVLLIAAIMLPLLQLVPLPPSVWQALPGRAALVEAAAASGQAQPWRPWSIVPAATANAAASLIVPLVTIMLVTNFKERARSWLPGTLLGLVVASALVGLLQLSGIGFNNLLINGTPGQVSGTFANRNHFALFLALGCMLAPVWAFFEGRRPQWRGPVALGFVLLFALTILASGSRAGLVLGLLGVVFGLALVRQEIRRALRRYPRWVFPVLIVSIIGVVGAFILISIVADRAVSIDRILAIDPNQDLRRRALPTVLQMIKIYFPAGTGLGSFDPIFRMHEPFDLLSLVYFNHAHNDFLEVVLDAGVPGLLLLVAALSWWAWASINAWRADSGSDYVLPKLGSAMLLLVVIASVSDYPARTPMIMVMVIVAATWLSDRTRAHRSTALPASGQPL